MKKLNNKTELSGIFGENITVRKVNGRVVIKNRPKRAKGKLTVKLQAQRDRFREASNYAKRQAADETAHALYSKRVKGKFGSVYATALADYINIPEVKGIDVIDYTGAMGDSIKVHAIDDFMVARVKVTITSADGVVIERGEASDAGGVTINIWEYKTVASNPVLAGTKIQATAYDRPGNAATAEIVL